ncbi:hypothetical protein EVAR_79013_1 [Eumeta japonica]|uniref:Uncharacterized protein n=1 Tax=Eumeta variegata TaxID=151549 RepID=A0A4C2AF41_EUMVA|nr:hypothetical protein EVAR_79013_1 [Eumeta japonica]
MDDYLQAFPDIETATRTIFEINEIHKAAAFQLRGWASNEPDALVATESLRREQKALSIGDHTERYRPPTKREVTSAVMSVFDPIGFAAPITVLGKMLIQNIWRDRNDWDHELSKERDKEWREWLSHLKN